MPLTASDDDRLGDRRWRSSRGPRHTEFLSTLIQCSKGRSLVTTTPTTYLTLCTRARNANTVTRTEAVRAATDNELSNRSSAWRTAALADVLVELAACSSALEYREVHAQVVRLRAAVTF